MTELPIIEPDDTIADKGIAQDNRLSRRIIVHCLRVALFVLFLVLLRFAHRHTEFVDTDLDSNETVMAVVNAAMDEPVKIMPFSERLGTHLIVNQSGRSRGSVLQTSPTSDNIVGYSGPTNCLITLDMDNKIQSVAIINSGDTIEHVSAVAQDNTFFDSFRGLDIHSKHQWSQIDAVSGATLTSYSIIASVANRIGEVSGQEINVSSLKFKPKPKLKTIHAIFPDATQIEPGDRQQTWNVFNADEKLGFVLTTTPTADHLSGYQGPTATIAGFNIEEKLIGLFVDQTYENEPYASYLNDDASFLKHYQSLTLNELSVLDPTANGIEGVSGATMTSMSVAEGLPLAANVAIQSSTDSDGIVVNQQQFVRKQLSRTRLSYWADLLTIVLTLIGAAFSFTKLSQRKWFRLAFQIAVILFLGFLNGHMLSQALVVGWSTHAIPWTVAPGLVFLSLAALVIPIFSKQQTYCHHVCPFGAMQQLGRNRLDWKIPIPKTAARILEAIPFLLLLLVVVVACTGARFNLASVEPFDGFSFRIAGWATIAILIVGLLFSLVSPMAYCRFGCPTGALLNFLRFRADSDQFGLRDVAAIALAAVAICLFVFSSFERCAVVVNMSCWMLAVQLSFMHT
jgi:Na+-translocating ferredoxin:NAD+ oxidoreductase RnfG subunit